MTRISAASQRTVQLKHHLGTMATHRQDPAPWRSPFLDHVSKLKPWPSFTLSTLHPISPSSSFASITPFEPRNRTLVFRGMWASLPVNPKNTAELNPEGAYESDLLTVVTDARMEKIPELFKSAGEVESRQSGTGGPVEAVFWIEDTNTQWRIRGHALVIGPDIDSDAASPIRSALHQHMRPSSSASASRSFSFARELTAHFGNLSPAMRGSYRNPPPGTPITQTPGPGLGLGSKVEDLDDEAARDNFRVLALVPEEVDRVDLSDPEDHRRWHYKLINGGGEVRTWKVTELWP